MKKYSFATIVSAADQLPVATHLPFVVSEKDGRVILTSHFARANPQWELLPKGPVLVMFMEPHAYISPAHYETQMSVPTWNYLAVHAYGQATLIDSPADTLAILEATINNYEPAYRQQWDGLPATYKQKMAKGIVAFEVNVTDLQAKKKLSQNKTETERNNIINTLSRSEHSNERDIAAYMQQEAGKDKS